MATYLETPELLAIASVLRSKKRAIQFLKTVGNMPFDKVLEAARAYAKELRRKSYQTTTEVRSASESSDRKELIFILRNLTLMGLPHKPTKEKAIRRVIRKSPSTWMEIVLTARGADEKIPEEDRVYLPFGINSRRVLAMICTIAVETKSPIITLDSAAEFMRRVGWEPDSKGVMGGNKYSRLGEALEAIQKCTMDVTLHGFGGPRKEAQAINILEAYDLPTHGDEQRLSHGETPLDLDPGVRKHFKVRIDPRFFRELCGDPATGYKGSAFPLPPWYIKNFTKSTELDVANFLAARVSAAQSVSKIDMHSVHEQLAFHTGNFSLFKSEFVKALKKVEGIWEGCNARVEGTTLIVGPVKNEKWLVDPKVFEQLPEDLFGTEPPPTLSHTWGKSQKTVE